MERVIEQAAERIIVANNIRMSRYPIEPISIQAAREYARALADAGLLMSIPAHRSGYGESIEEAYQRGHEDGY